MIRKRKGYPALGSGTFSWAPFTRNKKPDPIIAYYRSDQQDRILVIQNLSPDQQSLSLPFSETVSPGLIYGKTEIRINSGKLLADLDPYGFAWLRINR
jgi:hypothetical protein